MSKQPLGIGERVAERRKLNGLTQDQLAHRAHVSVSLVRKVETGQRPASPAFTAAVAMALRTTVAELYDQPSLRYSAERDHIAEVETAVMEGPASMTAYLPPELDALAARVDEIGKLQRRSRYHESSPLMPSLLAQLHTAAAVAPVGARSERAHHLLATLYGCVVICLHRLASPLVSQAADRAAEAARFSGDPLLAALCDQERALPLMYRGAYDTAQRIVTRAQGSIADQVSPHGRGNGADPRTGRTAPLGHPEWFCRLDGHYRLVIPAGGAAWRTCHCRCCTRLNRALCPPRRCSPSAAARALGAGPAELLGQPYPRDTPADHRVFAAIPALRRELTAYLLPPEEDAPARVISKTPEIVNVEVLGDG